jgi:hypothetical protein
VVITSGCVITAGIDVVVVACVVVVVACVVVCGGFAAVVVVVSEKQNIYIGRVFSFR